MTQIVSHKTFKGDRTSEEYFAEIKQANVICRNIIEASPDCFKVMDLDGRVEFMNRNGQCLMDIADFSAVESRSWRDLWPEDQQRKVTVALAAGRAGDTARFQGFCPTAAGIPKWWDVIVYCVTDGAGNPNKLVGVSRDITAARRIEEELQTMITELRTYMDLNRRADDAA